MAVVQSIGLTAAQSALVAKTEAAMVAPVVRPEIAGGTGGFEGVQGVPVSADEQKGEEYTGTGMNWVQVAFAGVGSWKKLAQSARALAVANDGGMYG